MVGRGITCVWCWAILESREEDMITLVFCARQAACEDNIFGSVSLTESQIVSNVEDGRGFWQRRIWRCSDVAVRAAHLPIVYNNQATFVFPRLPSMPEMLIVYKTGRSAYNVSHEAIKTSG